VRFTIYDLRFTISTLLTAVGVLSVSAQEPNQAAVLIDLPTALQLAGAQNLDVQLAREKLAEARANRDSAQLQFFPWLSPGVSYRRHDGRIQSTEGDILDVSKQSYAPGAGINAQVEIGEAIYKHLAARQLVKAAGYGLDAQRQEATAAAAKAYLDLALAGASITVAREAVSVSSNYEAQVRQAVDAGIAFRGDFLRVKVQTERNRLTLRQAIERQRLAGTRLAEVLHLDAVVELIAKDLDLLPLSLMPVGTPLSRLVQEALLSRPEAQQNRALVEAAEDAKDGAVYGPLIPSAQAQAFFGGLGGGRNGSTGNFGRQEDYFVGFGWRIGPGGLFDFSRTRLAEARLRTTQFTGEKIRDQISREVVDAYSRLQSFADQIETSRQGLEAAQEGLRLAQQRKEFGVGIVLENIQAEQDLTRARADYLRAVAQFNKAQYGLALAIGKPLGIDGANGPY
jgi:outer membrane protein TolC